MDEKSIDFDRVREFYDLYVTVTADIPFWTDVAAASRLPRLELMCGTGRIRSAFSPERSPFFIVSCSPR